MRVEGNQTDYYKKLSENFRLKAKLAEQQVLELSKKVQLLEADIETLKKKQKEPEHKFSQDAGNV